MAVPGSSCPMGHPSRSEENRASAPGSGASIAVPHHLPAVRDRIPREPARHGAVAQFGGRIPAGGRAWAPWQGSGMRLPLQGGLPPADPVAGTVVQIACDESGFSGTNLLDPATPVFTHASVDLSV